MMHDPRSGGGHRTAKGRASRWVRLSVAALLLIAVCSGCAAAEAPAVEGEEVAWPAPATPTVAPPPVEAPSEADEPLDVAALPTAVPLTAAIAAEGAPDEPVARVNGEPLPREEYARQLALAQSYLWQQPGLEADSAAGRAALAQLEAQVLYWLIDQMVIEQAARGEGIAIDAGLVEAELERMRAGDAARFAAWLDANGLTEEDVRAQIRSELVAAALRDAVTADLSREAPQVRVRHILTTDEPGAQAARARVLAGEDFAAVADQLSEDESTRAQGGDLGYIPRGVMPPAFDEAAFALPSGGLSEVVRSEFGYHLILVEEAAAARTVSDHLWPAVQQRAFTEWLEQRRAQAEIELFWQPS